MKTIKVQDLDDSYFLPLWKINLGDLSQNIWKWWRVENYTRQVCNSFQPEEKCNNPDCGGFFSHSLVGLSGGDTPEGFVER